MAVGTEQITWSNVMTYLHVVLKLAEDERVKGNEPNLAFVYDSMFRESVSRRSRNADPQLDIDEVLSKLDENVLSAARSRIQQNRRPQQPAGPPPQLGDAMNRSASAAIQVDKAANAMRQAAKAQGKGKAEETARPIRSDRRQQWWSNNAYKPKGKQRRRDE